MTDLLTTVSPQSANPSPWHEGERRMQEQVGVRARMEEIGRRLIRDYMPDQHRTFFQQLPSLVVGTVDAAGDPWVSQFEGEPGFLASPDPKLLTIAGRFEQDDPARVAPGALVGLLGIAADTRRRNRMNGRLLADGSGLAVAVEHSFGNCPQYIQTRTVRLTRRAERPAVETTDVLTAEGRVIIGAADTFYVASYVDLDGDTNRRQVDVSHRGGKTGFVRIGPDGLLTIPDFAGNLHFNTLGNLILNPRAGLLFLDHETGDMLQMTGEAAVILESPEIAAFQGAERLWTFRPRKVVLRRAASRLRWRFGAWSPNSLMTGSWEEAASRIEAEALGKAWRPFRIARIVQESDAIRSFHLEPDDGIGISRFEAGQHLPIRLKLPSEPEPVVRTYTVSAAPSDPGYRISVKRDGVASRFLHDTAKEGDVIEARAPRGAFTVDPRERRPLVLMGAGVGVTPMLAMLRHVIYEGARTRRTRPTVFFQASRTVAGLAFTSEIADLVARAAGAVRAVSVVSGPEEGKSAGVDFDIEGHIDIELLKRTLPFDDHDFYLCGPAGFMQATYDVKPPPNFPDRVCP